MMIKDIDQLEATCDSELCKGHYQEDLIMESKLQSGLHVTPLLQYCYFAEYTLVFLGECSGVGVVIKSKCM